jgi:hypothetical protein
VLGQVQDHAACPGGDARGDVDQPAAQGGDAGAGVNAAGQTAGGAGEVERECRTGQPDGVGGEASGREMRQWAVFEVVVDGLDDRVLAVGGLRVDQLGGAGGEEGVIPPDREHRVRWFWSRIRRTTSRPLTR